MIAVSAREEWRWSGLAGGKIVEIAKAVPCLEQTNRAASHYRCQSPDATEPRTILEANENQPPRRKHCTRGKARVAHLHALNSRSFSFSGRPKWAIRLAGQTNGFRCPYKIAPCLIPGARAGRRSCPGQTGKFPDAFQDRSSQSNWFHCPGKAKPATETVNKFLDTIFLLRGCTGGRGLLAG